MNTTSRAPLSILIALFAQALLCGQPQFQKIREGIPKRLTDTNTPSLAIAVAQNGRIIWEEGFGWADREKQIAASPEMPYPVASLTKPFTATALMILVESGQLNLDAPANQYLAASKLHARIGDASPATVRRLADHTSGLPSHYQIFARDQPLRPPSMDETIRRFGNLVTPPGEHYEYSNLGYGILGYIIERVSGKSYGAFLRNRVFVPLGLHHTSVGADPRSPHASRYDSHGSRLPEFETDHPGAAAVYASAHDLALFGLFHLKENTSTMRPILKTSSIDLMHTTLVDTGPNLGYGLGW